MVLCCRVVETIALPMYVLAGAMSQPVDIHSLPYTNIEHRKERANSETRYSIPILTSSAVTSAFALSDSCRLDSDCRA